MNKNESKYFNTAIKMDEALITLLEKKDFEYITVKEICTVAGVNRSTFYLHYENTYDLLKETTEYIINKHLSYYGINKHSICLEYENCEKGDLIFITEKYLTPYLTFIKENQRIFKVSIRHFNAFNMGAVYDQMFNHIFNPILDCFHVPQKERPYVMKFYLTGVFAVIIEWLDKSCSDDINAVSKTITDCVIGDRSING